MRRFLIAFLLVGALGQAQSIKYAPPAGAGTGSASEAESVAFAALGTPADGTFYYCTDCTQTNPCAGSGDGAFAQRIDGAWSCSGGSGTTGLADPGSNGIVVRTAADTTVARSIGAGPGIVVSNGPGTAGDPTVSIDSATVVGKGTGATDPPASCGDTGDTYQLLDTYLNTSTRTVFVCTAVDAWSLRRQERRISTF